VSYVHRLIETILWTLVELVASNFPHTYTIFGPFWVPLFVRVIKMVSAASWIMSPPHNISRHLVNLVVRFMFLDFDITVIPALKLPRFFAYIGDTVSSPVSSVLGDSVHDDVAYPLLSLSRFSSGLAVYSFSKNFLVSIYMTHNTRWTSRYLTTQNNTLPRPSTKQNNPTSFTTASK